MIDTKPCQLRTFKRLKEFDPFYGKLNAEGSLSADEYKKLNKLLSEVRKSDNEHNIKSVEELFFKKHLNLLYSMLIKNFDLTPGDIYDEEDLMQEIYLKYWQIICSYNPETSKAQFSSYLYKCLVSFVPIFNKKNANPGYEKELYNIEKEDTDEIIENAEYYISNVDVFNEVAKIELGKCLNEALYWSLTEREEKVLKLRYGLDDGQDRTLEEVGQIFGVTRNRIRQIEIKALRKLRHPSRTNKLKDFLID